METRHPEDHYLISFDKFENGNRRIYCSCGAKWMVNEKEWERQEDKMEYHIAYAKRTATRVD